MNSRSASKDKKIVENSAEILRLFAGQSRKLTQIELTKNLPLKRTSIYYAFEFLERNGFIAKAGESPSSGRGIPRILWELNPKAGAFLVVYMAHSKITFSTYDFNGALLSCKSVAIRGGIDEALKTIAAKVRELKGQRLCGMIVSLAGIIEGSSGEVFISKAWNLRNYPLRQELADALPDWAPPLLIVENRARAAAWGERCAGACVGIDNFITLYVEEAERGAKSSLAGVGSGVVIDGLPFKGGHGAAGELDHSFYQWYAKASDLKEPFSFGSMPKERAKDFGFHLGEGMSHIVNYLSVEKVLLSFEGVEPPEPFISAFRQKILQNLLPFKPMTFPVELSSLGSGAVAIGSLDMLRRAYFSPGNQPLVAWLASSL